MIPRKKSSINQGPVASKDAENKKNKGNNKTSASPSTNVCPSIFKTDIKELDEKLKSMMG